MNNFQYYRAANIREAIERKAGTPASRFLAGGTNLIDLMKYHVMTPDSLIDIGPVSESRDVQELPEGGMRLSAFSTNADTAYDPLVLQKYPLLSRAILAGASAQIRNMATNGGNLLQRTRCYYFYDAHVPCNKREPGSGCPAINGYNRTMAILGTSEHCIATFPSDMCVALAALGAIVNVSGPAGERRIAFQDFHKLPGNEPQIDNTLLEEEIITSIDLPANGFVQNYSYLKLRDRNSYAFALVSVATALEMDGDTIREARMALGGVAHKPWRNVEAEMFLQGKTASPENFALAADIILAEAVGYRHNAFKIELAKRAIIRNGIMALQPESQLPGAGPSI